MSAPPCPRLSSDYHAGQIDRRLRVSFRKPQVTVATLVDSTLAIHVHESSPYEPRNPENGLVMCHV
jgi:hypothetical protein